MASGKLLNHVEGGNALSEFRARALLAGCARGRPAVDVGPARYLHVVWSEEPLAGAIWPRRGAAALRRSVRGRATADTTLIVAPRLGTISPWASKATDIARNCGLAGAPRSSASSSSGSALKRGLLGGAKPLDAGERAALAAAAARPHDRERARRPRRAARICSTSARRSRCSRSTCSRRPRRAGTRRTRELGLALSDDEIDYLLAPSRDSAATRPTSN